MRRSLVPGSMVPNSAVPWGSCHNPLKVSTDRRADRRRFVTVVINQIMVVVGEVDLIGEG